MTLANYAVGTPSLNNDAQVYRPIHFRNHNMFWLSMAPPTGNRKRPAPPPLRHLLTETLAPPPSSRESYLRPLGRHSDTLEVVSGSGCCSMMPASRKLSRAGNPLKKGAGCPIMT
ncbi:hypothetical protein Pelo_4308 [Pelomyxa schiedti]|nr:hypothetical protein Pelo_4308 [Pelomyxa schiedti]